MLLLIIFTLATIIGVVLLKLNRDVWDVIGITLALIGGCAMLICGLFLAAVNVQSDSEYEKMKAKHDALMTADKGDIVTLTKDIAEYNGEVKAGRELLKSPWVGLYQYDWWDDLETIEIGSLGKEDNYDDEFGDFEKLPGADSSSNSEAGVDEEIREESK